jgi:hypothetical protein
MKHIILGSCILFISCGSIENIHHTNPCVLELEAPATAPDLEQTFRQASCPALLKGWSLEESLCLLKTKDIRFDKYHNFHVSNFSDTPQPLLLYILLSHYTIFE